MTTAAGHTALPSRPCCGRSMLAPLLLAVPVLLILPRQRCHLMPAATASSAVTQAATAEAEAFANVLTAATVFPADADNTRVGGATRRGRLLANASSSSAPAPSPFAGVAIFTDTSMYIAGGALAGIAVFVAALSVVSKQLERRSNLSKFDENLSRNYYEANDDVLRAIQGSGDHPGAGGFAVRGSVAAARSSYSTDVAADIRGDENSKRRRRRRSTVMGIKGSITSEVARARSFAVNLTKTLGQDDTPLPSVRTMCDHDIIIVDPAVNIGHLIQDCEAYCREAATMHYVGASKGDGDSIASAVSATKAPTRPRFLCLEDFKVVTASAGHASKLLTQGFDGIVLRGLDTELNSTAVTKSAAADAMRAALTKVLDVTSAVGKPLLVEIDCESPQALLSEISLSIVNGLFFRNPTCDMHGKPHLVWGDRFDAMDAFIAKLKHHVSMTVDFTILSINAVDSVDAVAPEIMQAFNSRAWARSVPVRRPHLHRPKGDVHANGGGGDAVRARPRQGSTDRATARRSGCACARNPYRNDARVGGWERPWRRHVPLPWREHRRHRHRF